MDCSQCRENLSEYIDGELPEAEQEDIALHVRDCPDCAAVLARMRRTVEALSGLPPEAPPQDFMVRLNGRLDAEDLRRSRRPRFFFSRWFLLPGAATVAVACLAIVLVSRFTGIPLPGPASRQTLPRISRDQAMPAAGAEKAAPELKSAPAAVPLAEARRQNSVALKKEKTRAAQSESEPPAASAAKDASGDVRKGAAAVPVALEWRGSTSGMQETSTVAIYDEAAWAKLCRRHAPGIFVPKIDFNYFMALAVFQGTENPESCCLKITGIVQGDEKTSVYYAFDDASSEKGRGPFSSFHIKLIKKSASPVVFIKSRLEKQTGQK